MVHSVKRKGFLTRLRKSNKKLLYAYIFLIIAVIGSIVAFYLVKQQLDIRENAQQNSTDIILNFDKNDATPSQILTMDVSIDTHQTPVKELQLDFSYPSQKVTPKLVFDSSIFQDSTEELVGSGIIRFGRSAQKATAGKIHIGKIQFLASSDVTMNEINHLPNSTITSIDRKSIPLYVTKELKKNSESNSQNFIEKMIRFIQSLLPS